MLGTLIIIANIGMTFVSIYLSKSLVLVTNPMNFLKNGYWKIIHLDLYR